MMPEHIAQLGLGYCLPACAQMALAHLGIRVAVTTTPGLPGWGETRTQHTVFVTTINPEWIRYHDPVLPHGPVAAPPGEFLLAWSEMAELAAFVRRT